MNDTPHPIDPTAMLAARAREGDREAYDELFAQAARRLELYVRLRLGKALREREESLDLLQETYLAAHRTFDRFEDRGDDAFVRWLCQIAENCIRARADYHGAAKRRPPAELEHASSVLDRVEKGTLGPVTRAERTERRQQLVLAMEELPREEREAMLLRHFEGRDLETIAERLGTSATSARRILGRATVRLGALLQPTGGGES